MPDIAHFPFYRLPRMPTPRDEKTNARCPRTPSPSLTIAHHYAAHFATRSSFAAARLSPSSHR
jgi:hypothetical protein